MSSYVGHHADLFDLFYAEKPYRQEASFVHRCIERWGGGSFRKLLELACGTGTHALELEKLGYQIIATDYSPDMLNCARRKAAQCRSQVDFRCEDMRQLNLPERPFDVAICLFDSLGYVVSNKALDQVLHNVAEHLRPGGLFLFEFWHAGAMLRHYDRLRVRRWDIANGESIIRLSETQLNYLAQTAAVTYTILHLRPDGSCQQLQETQTNRFFLAQEMAAFLERNGLQPLKWFSGFSDDEVITDQTWHIVSVCRRS